MKLTEVFKNLITEIAFGDYSNWIKLFLTNHPEKILILQDQILIQMVTKT